MKTNTKKSVAAITGIGIMTALLVVFNNVGATILTAGNDTTERPTLDTFTNFVVVDTNNPVSGLGQLDTFDYYASNLGSLRFLIVDGDSNEVLWVSDLISPVATGSQSYSPADPVVVHEGDNIGLYFESAASVPFESVGSASWYMSDDSGLPVSGAVLSYLGSANRTYSFSATGIVGEMPSVPEITSPGNNSTVASASFTVVDWTDSIGTFDPITYKFEMYSSVTYAPETLVSSSSWQSDSEFGISDVEEGDYYLRVRSQDDLGNMSEWSNGAEDPHKVTVDNVEPTPTPTDEPTPTPTATPTPSPTDKPSEKDDCKKEGWSRFTEIFFKNQGQCVSHINGRDDNHGQHVRGADDKKEAAKSDVGKRNKDKDDRDDDDNDNKEGEDDD